MKKKLLLLPLAVILSNVAFADNHAQPTVYGQYLAIVASDPAAVVEAMTRYRQSTTGKKLSSTVTLSANVANGRDQATHTISVFYPSLEAMDADYETSMGSSDRAAFVAAMQGAARIETENVFTQTQSRINDEGLDGGQGATMLFALTVTDPERYSKALEKILNSDAAEDFPGNMSSGGVMAMGEDPGTHWVSFQAANMATLISGVEKFMSSDDFADYSEDASEFRRVEGRYISRAVMTLSPQ